MRIIAKHHIYRVQTANTLESNHIFENYPFEFIPHFLASQDALEVMRVTESLTHLLTYSLTHLLTYSLTGVRCRATSVAKNDFELSD